MAYLLIVILLLCSAFFSGTEIAYTSLSKIKIKKENENPSTTQKLVNYIYNHYDYALSTVLVGNNLVNIAATSVATVLAVRLAVSMNGKITEDTASSIVTILMTVLILIIGEITPKMIARRCNESYSKLAAYPLMVLMVLFFPVVWITSCIVNLFSHLWKKKDAQEVTITEEELENLLDTAEDEGVIDENETELLQSALEFTDLDAADILTPRIDVVGFEINDSMETVLKVIAETQFSRFPVYERTIDHVVGILYVKHLLKELVHNKDVKLSDLLLEPVYIPKSMRLHDIMNEFRNNQTHMTVVADEYGGIMGIVTMEDVLEQLVGEIWDENDDIVNNWQQLDKYRYECSGDMNLTEFFDNLDLDEDELETDCATVGGWATATIGAMPVPFDSFDYKQFTILVKHVDENHRITRLLVIEHTYDISHQTDIRE
ncbi:MAG: HlyC/CorC family transporter [Lachnospiraceae bacterium]|nr:HlyC/CorC family transporter [Lachnospiraceae bacterium]MBR2401861.1 HlyC/CorC family transporter [Lachnospiraceae bacterium]MBR4060174.1 HlyC/CorC family transporter [Lachnospiraceae bacterium]